MSSGLLRLLQGWGRSRELDSKKRKGKKARRGWSSRTMRGETTSLNFIVGATTITNANSMMLVNLDFPSIGVQSARGDI